MKEAGKEQEKGDSGMDESTGSGSGRGQRGEGGYDRLRATRREMEVRIGE